MVKRNKILIVIFIFLLTLPFLCFSLTCRYCDHNDFTRVVFEGDSPFNYNIEKNPDGIKLELNSNENIKIDPENFKSERIELVKFNIQGKKTRFKFKFKRKLDNKSFVLKDPYRVVVDFFDISGESKVKKKYTSLISSEKTITNKESNSEKEITSSSKVGKSGNNGSEKQAVGLGNNERKDNSVKVIVIDPGHGGSEDGAKGPNGFKEKDITLKISRYLKSYIENKIGIKVFMTRNSDRNISLEQRASIANNHKADMFISVHCNGYRSTRAHGSETYILSMEATDREARKLAFFENNFEEMEPNEEMDDIKLILWDMAQTKYLKESAVLAEYIQRELNDLLNTKDRGIKQAPFRVLMNVAMPAVLIEAAFLTNKEEEKMLSSPEGQRKIAYAVFQGIRSYLRIK